MALGLTIYSNSLSKKFIWDDEFLVKDNTYIRNLVNIKEIFTKDIGAGAENIYYSYRPVQTLTYMLDYSLWKLNLKGYHFTNIVLHILAALAFYWLCNTLFADKVISFIASSLFVAFPLHTEAVSYVSGRADSLAALFLLLSFIFYIKSNPKNATGRYIIVLLAYILAILSKEYALILPLMLVSYHYVFRTEYKFKRFLPILAVTFLYILIRLTVLSALMPPKALILTSLWQRLPGVFVALANYIRFLFLPFNLHMEYGNTVFSPMHPKAILGAAIFIFFMALAFLKRRNNALISFSIFWFFIFLFPQSNIFPVNAYMSEHWLYLASAGFFLVLAYGLACLYRTKGLKSFTIFLLISVLLFYSFLTVRQNSYWRDPVIFYERTLKYAPHSARALYNLGNALRDIGKYREAMASYDSAIKNNPNHIGAYNNLGALYSDIGNPEEAVSLYKKAIEIDPGHAKAYNNLANVYKETGRTDEAIILYKKAIEIKPDYADAYYNLGSAYAAMGRPREAIPAYQKTIEINPGYLLAYTGLGDVYYEAGNLKEALTLYTQAIKLKPDYAEAYNRLGILLYTAMEKKEEAIAAFKKAIETNPCLADAHNNLAVAYYYYKKQYGLAAKHCDQAAELGYKVNPDFLKQLQPYRKSPKPKKSEKPVK
ncbi:MAG: tetratricopeptide repeat protein [Candidatus Omnitrophica bacterium]|nr:tetratricopeptide repeat protein [Candidatus Omnitrophota bacterium]MDD5591688.1 tetratricopeptide repeat protein [Candidatus Omnitrophota bacterium]